MRTSSLKFKLCAFSCDTQTTALRWHRSRASSR
ncbi:hypothetical protein F444_22315 [Phytophthora nicotianae P1976]|uniref:Uncharacterized protein n=1 Tax=Phytophthora nicotianae P1976 TaxID=1317066 RepID=A0A080YY52_PHYNI|nr:hypothetical protein F444_22315 [Phytophthora nicotianae P1976]